MPRCVQCTISKKKCNPESRQWPEVCELCLKSGLPCSPFVSKAEFDSLSAGDLAAYQKKVHLRSSEDIIADLDCLYYLRESIQESLSASSGHKAMKQLLYDRIKVVIAEIQHEASATIHQQVIRGRGTEAYFLSAFVVKGFSYDNDTIWQDYTMVSHGFSSLKAPRDPDIAILDRSAGLLFRWLKGATTEPPHGSVWTKNVSRSITEAEATRLYRTLQSISDKCLQGLGIYQINSARNCCSTCQRNYTDSKDLFLRIDPPLLRYLRIWPVIARLTNGNREGLSNMISAGKAVGIVDIVNLSNESLLHLSIKNAALETGLYWSRGTRRHKVESGYPFKTVETALHCGLTSTAFNLQNSYGKTPIQHAIRIYPRGNLSLNELIALSTDFSIRQSSIYVSPDEIRQQIQDHEFSKRLDITSVPMTPLMYAIYVATSQGYGAVNAILRAGNKDAWISETSSVPVSSILSEEYAKSQSIPTSFIGPIHIAVWAHDGRMVEKILSNKGTFSSQFNIAATLAITTRSYALLVFLRRILMKVNPSEDVATEIIGNLRDQDWLWSFFAQTLSQAALNEQFFSTNRQLLLNLLILLSEEVDPTGNTHEIYISKEVQSDEELDEESDIDSDEELDRGSDDEVDKAKDGRPYGELNREGLGLDNSTSTNEFYKRQTEKENTEHRAYNNKNGPQDSDGKLNRITDEELQQMKEDDSKYHQKHNDKEGGKNSNEDIGEESLQQQNNGYLVSAHIPDASDTFLIERMDLSKTVESPSPSGNKVKGWGSGLLSWKGISGGALGLGSSFLSKASNSTASSGGSIMSIGGMPFRIPHRRPTGIEMPMQKEVPENMEIDSPSV